MTAGHLQSDRVTVAVALVVLALSPAVHAEVAFGVSPEGVAEWEVPVELTLWPGVSVPVGNARGIARLGAGGDVEARLGVARLPVFVGLRASFGRAWLVPPGTLDTVSLFAGAGARVPVAPWLRLAGSLYLGYGHSTLAGSGSSGSGGGVGYAAAITAEVPVSERVAVGLRAGYLAHANTYHGVQVGAGAVVSFPGAKRRAVERRYPGEEPDPRVDAPAILSERSIVVLVFGMEAEDIDTGLLLRLLGRDDIGEGDGEPAAELSGTWEGAFVASVGEDQTSLPATASLVQRGTAVTGIATLEEDEEPGRRRTYVIVHATVVGSEVAGLLQWVERPEVLVGLVGTIDGATIEGRWYDTDELGPFEGTFVLSRPGSGR